MTDAPVTQGNQRETSAAAVLYRGDVMHARLKPFGHRFVYRVTSLLIDLDRLDEAAKQSRLFNVNARGLFSFHERDHGDRDGTPLRAFVDRAARIHGIDLSGGKVALLCYPRMFGHVFNPLSVYFCRDAHGALRLMIYEVRNTFGGIQHYVLPVAADERYAPQVRQSQAKTFYVSPFIAMAMRYDFRVSPPQDDVKLHILESDAEGPLLVATFKGDRTPLATRQILTTILSMPLMTVKIVAAIHWEALKLWIKGARLVPRPPSFKARAADIPPPRADNIAELS